jgi:hypothetical protein
LDILEYSHLWKLPLSKALLRTNQPQTKEIGALGGSFEARVDELPEGLGEGLWEADIDGVAGKHCIFG